MRGDRGQSTEEFWESSDSDRSRKAGGDGVLGLEPRVGPPWCRTPVSQGYRELEMTRWQKP